MTTQVVRSVIATHTLHRDEIKQTAARDRGQRSRARQFGERPDLLATGATLPLSGDVHPERQMIQPIGQRTQAMCRSADTPPLVSDV
jgi:hypothetical protein